MRRAGLVIVVLALWGLITHGTYAGSGDEPHYLAIAHSIAFDGDLDLANNYGANEPLVGGGVLQPESHVRPGIDGTARPVHDVGMPLIFAPYVRLAVPLTNLLTRTIPEPAMRRARLNPPVLYRHFLSFAMIALAAVLAGLMFDAFRWLGATPRAALGTMVLIALSPPLLFFSVLFFTELLSALLCFIVFSALTLADDRRQLTPMRWLWLGCLAGLLFLVHARNIGLVVPLVALALYTLRAPDRRRDAAAFLVGTAALVAIRAGVNFLFWGAPISGPHARMGQWPGWTSLIGESATRIAGLLADQEFGLLIYAPVYLLVAWGAVSMRRTRPRVLSSLAVVIGVYLVLIVCPVTNVHGWTGGWTPPGRFLTPVVPLLGLLVFAGLRSAPRPLVIAVVTLQVAISAYAWQHPKLLWNDGDGRAAFCDQVGDGVCRHLPALATSMTRQRSAALGTATSSAGCRRTTL